MESRGVFLFTTEKGWEFVNLLNLLRSMAYDCILGNCFSWRKAPM
jgi:hypothetical protein